MCFEMRGIDHQHIIGIAGSGQRSKYLVEHTHAAPANEAIIDRFMWPVSSGGIAPAQTTLRRSSTLGTPCDNGKYGSIRRICALLNINRSLISGTSFEATIESQKYRGGNPFNRS